MNFRLVEEPTEAQNQPKWPPSRQMLDDYSKLLTEREQLLFIENKILPHKVFSKLSGVKSIIIDSIMSFGINPRRNLFLDFLSKLPISITDSKGIPKMRYIFDSFKNKKLDIRMEVLNNPTLWDRSDNEFKYTINAFNLMSDPKKAKAYIKDIKVININEFFEDGDDPRTSTIKKAGIHGEKGDTIFNVIERWADNNEYSPEEIAKRKSKDKSESDGKHTIREAIKGPWNYELFKSYIEEVFEDSIGYDISFDKELYLERLFMIFELPNLKKSLDTYIKTPNLVTKPINSFGEIDDEFIKSHNFGDVDKVDEPIPLTVYNKKSKSTTGVYVFHNFIPVEDNAEMARLQTSSYTLLNIFKSATNITNIKDRHSVLQGLITTLEECED